ncbi:MAG TPA: ATP-binding protein [Steroidobacteraceae bacterium]|nr:ATP-binding protein [Steroidobacteraceae bacterium]
MTGTLAVFGAPAVPAQTHPLQASAPAGTTPVLRLLHAEYLPDWCAQAPPPSGARGIAVRLPVILDAANSHPCATGAQWKRLTFRLPVQPNAHYAVYLIHAEPESAVYVNGNYLGAYPGFDDPSSRSWNYPLYLPLPTALLHAGGAPDELLIESRAQGSGYSQVGPVWVGDSLALNAAYARQLWLRVIGVEVVSLLVGLIGLFTLLLWLRRRHETIVGLFALSCGIWIVRNTQFFVIREYSPFYFALITDAALFWLVAVLYSLCFRIMELRSRWFERSLYLYALLITVTMWSAGPHYKPLATTIGYALLIPSGVVFQFYLTRETWRSPSVLRCLLWLAAIVSTATGGYDLLLMMNLLPWRDGYLMPYSALFYALTVGWALVDRFVKTHNQYEQLNIELEARVRQRERQLAGHYARTAHLESEQAVAAERARILRDMHDGLGLHLISALRLIDHGEPLPQPPLRAQLAAVLSDAMDELRIAIDSIKPSARDLLVMLGNLRYRLEPRLSAAGISLHWQVDDGADIARLTATQVVEVTRIVQELCTNAMKHSRASDMFLRIEGLPGERIRITVTDNGVGFDTTRELPGEGLSNIRRRAANLGAALLLHSEPGHTQTAVTLALAPGLAAAGLPPATVAPARPLADAAAELGG